MSMRGGNGAEETEKTTLRKRAEELIAGIEHGDEVHRKWLRDTFTPQVESFAFDVLKDLHDFVAVAYSSPLTAIRVKAYIDGLNGTHALAVEGTKDGRG